jgi:hypothetical protein
MESAFLFVKSTIVTFHFHFVRTAIIIVPVIMYISPEWSEVLRHFRHESGLLEFKPLFLIRMSSLTRFVQRFTVASIEV